jgi:hypothetical protein
MEGTDGMMTLAHETEVRATWLLQNLGQFDRSVMNNAVDGAHYDDKLFCEATFALSINGPLDDLARFTR